jgi:hypothetical protein
VKNREKSCRAIREDAENMEELSNWLAESAGFVITLDIEKFEGEEQTDNYIIKKFTACC